MVPVVPPTPTLRDGHRPAGETRLAGQHEPERSGVPGPLPQTESQEDVLSPPAPRRCRRVHPVFRTPGETVPMSEHPAGGIMRAVVGTPPNKHAERRSLTDRDPCRQP